MNSVAPSSMFAGPAVRAVGTTSNHEGSQTAAAALLAIVSLPAIVFGGRPFETIGAIAKIVALAISQDFSSK